MRIPSKLEAGRVRHGEWGSPTGALYGAFLVKLRPGGPAFKVIASSGEGWDHVSISLPGRCPTWSEMSAFKDLFFEPEDAVMQLHPPVSDYVNLHPFCLHLWRPLEAEIPLPPSWMVGPKGSEAKKAAGARR